MHFGLAARNAAVAAIAALCNGGKIAFMDGAQPANAGVAITSQKCLVVLTFAATAYAAPSGGSATANAIGSGTIGSGAGVEPAGGTATWARIYEADGTTAVLDCSVGAADHPTTGDTYDILVPTTTFTPGVSLTMSSNVLSMSA